MFGDTGRVSKNGDVNVITFQRELNAPPARVWEALTTEDGITSWLAVSARIDGRKGGNVRIKFDDDQEVSGAITQWDPTSRFAHTWVIDEANASEVEYTLESVGDTTQLTLVHTGLSDEMRIGYTPGWHTFMVRLEAHLKGEIVPEWLAVFEKVAPEYQ